MKITKHTNTRNRIIRYLVVGLTAFFTEYLVFVIMNSGEFTLLASQTVSFCCGLLISFIGNRTFTFGEKDTQYKLSGTSQLWRYATLALINLALSNVVIHFLVIDVTLHPLFAKMLVMAAVVMWNFIVFNKIIFRKA